MTDQSHRFDTTDIRLSDMRINVPPSWVDPAHARDDEQARMLRTAILQPSAELMALRGKTEAAATQEPCLVLHSGKAQGTAINLMPMDNETTSTWIIGCQDNCDILLNEVGVSAFHAIVAHTDGQWTLADQQSASGTFVNGKPCLKKVLQDGDQLQFGLITSTFHVPEAYRAKVRVSKAERLMRAVRAVMSLPRSILRRKHETS